MIIKQFENANLSHYSYAVLCDDTKELVLIDPSRDPAEYFQFAAEHQARIIGIIETHSHADFVSGHLEIAKVTGGTIYASRYLDPSYSYEPFDDGDRISVGNMVLKAMNTPGHSEDSICIVLAHNGVDKAVFTGDTLFIGDCGRPDLRESKEDEAGSRQVLARKMFHSLRNRLIVLKDSVIVYPAHGAGTLCGKSLSKAASNTIGEEKATNWSLQPQTEREFVTELLTDQPFIPKYFCYDVELNRAGATGLEESLERVSVRGMTVPEPISIDTRDQGAFKAGHLENSVNIMRKGKFETWLGSIIWPKEKFCLIAESRGALAEVLQRAASIGYETQVERAYFIEDGPIKEPKFDVASFKAHWDDYMIIDVRNKEEARCGELFPGSVNIPLGELRERTDEIPINKPIAVHCSGGYRSAVGSSLLRTVFKGKAVVFDVGEAIGDFKEKSA